MDWFRLAQKPTGQWLKLVRAKLPRTSLPKDKVAALNAWKPGQPLLWQEGCAPPHGAARLIPEETLEGLPPNVDLAQDISGEWPCPVCDVKTITARGLQVHYEAHHAVQDENVTTVEKSRCSLCGHVFVTEVDVKRHVCLDALWALPALPEMPNFVGRSVTGWELNTDGSGASDEGPHAGWGIAVWVEGVRSVLPEFELFGPVPLQSWEPRWMGADIASNNVGELTAMLEALLWLEQEAPSDAGLPARIRFDSTYAHSIITGAYRPHVNLKLASEAKKVFERVSQLRPLAFEKVKGHSGYPGNDHADYLAGLGSKGQQTRQSSRWLIPVGRPAPVQPWQVDWCWRCGKVFSGPSHARQLAGHEGQCHVPSVPPPHIPCRKGCGRQFEWRFPSGRRKQAHHAREYRHMHEKLCSGDKRGSRTCPF